MKTSVLPGCVYFIIVRWLLFLALDGRALANHTCDRSCDDGVQMTCEYNFTVEWYLTMSKACHDCPSVGDDCSFPDCITGNGKQRAVMSVNRQIPGPTIKVCEGDRVVVRVQNNLFNGEATSIHWHGIRMRNNNHMDGVGRVTQCPIPSDGHFTYDFIADPAGTHMYHAHTGSQRIDGVYGPVIVQHKHDPHKELYDHDIHSVMIQDWAPVPFTSIFMMQMHDKFKDFNMSAVINGKGHKYLSMKDGNTSYTPREVFRVRPGQRYRFRVVNTGDDATMKVSVDGHRLTAIASDGSPFTPVDVNYLTVHEGETFDFILHANQTAGNYWFRARRAPKSFATYGIVRYEGVDEVDPQESLEFNTDNGKFLNPTFSSKAVDVLKTHGPDNDIDIDDLRAVEETESFVNDTPDIKLYLGLDFVMNDNSRFNHPLYYPASYRPHYTSLINNISMVLPHSPLVETQNSSSPEEFCSYETIDHDECYKEICRCVHGAKIPLGAVVELVMFTQGTARWDSGHPIHMHGGHFYVLGREKVTSKMLLRHQVQAWDEAGQLKRNYDRPLLKHTVHVPGGGYVIAKFKADNPGYWLLHCHMDGHSEQGMGMTLQIGDPADMPALPDGFPRCGQTQGFSPKPGTCPNTQTTDGAKIANPSAAFVELVLCLLYSLL